MSKKCENIFCKNAIKKEDKESIGAIKQMKKELSKINKTLKSKKISTTEKQNLENKKSFLTVFTKKESKKEKQKTKKLRIDVCKKTYCNVDCKNTIFEKGNTLSDGFINNLKKKKTNSIIDLHQNQRKQIFGNKTDVLKDNFYEKLSKKTITQLKKEGAISGCFRNV